jgi:D-ribose pyranase
MRRSGVIINGRLIELVTSIGHTQTLVIADAGLPIPSGVECIDLAVRAGLPGFLDVLDCVLAELQVERAVLAREIETLNPDLFKGTTERFGAGVLVDLIPHGALKQRLVHARAIVRTGEFSPYANVELYGGVVF